MTSPLSSLPRIDYQAHPAYGGMLEPDPRLGEEALGILRPVIEEMTRVEAERVQKFGYRYGASGEADAPLVEQSYIQSRLPSAAMDRIEAAAKPYVTALKAKLEAPVAAGQAIPFKMVNHVMGEAGDPEIWRAVDDAMREAGAMESVRAFFSAQSAKLNSLAVFVNPPNQSWIGAPFRDLSAETPPTAGMHIDSNGKCYLKAILYLNEVGPDQGPTSVVPSSHAWDQGGTERIWRRAFDRSKLLGRSENERRMFISLPREMQVKAEFGGDLLEGSPESRALLEQEFASVGERGAYTLFNPEAVHRGGAVRSGERQALQITLAARF
jgi:hypothetical protein